MGYVTVSFLGEQYKVSEAINQYLHFDQILVPINLKMMDALLKEIQKSKYHLSYRTFDMEQFADNAKKYQKLMNESANILVNELFALGVYDVTASELLEPVTSIKEINQLVVSTLQCIVDEMQRYVNLKNRGMEEAYRYAAQSVTGSGTTVFSSSMATLLIHSAVERGIVMTQAKNADEEYKRTAQAIIERTRHSIDRMIYEVVFTKYYPALQSILIEFNNEITASFIVKLTQHDKLDFASIESYDMKKAEVMLSNFHLASDKIAFLRQAFNVCPFCVSVYKKCLDNGLLDNGTFQTAAYFGMAEVLIKEMETYVSENRDNIALIEPIICILSEYKNVDKTEILKELYWDIIKPIQTAYEDFRLALESKSALDSFIRRCLNPKMTVIVNVSEAEASAAISDRVSSILSDDQYAKLVRIGVLSPTQIRRKDSTAITLGEINTEFSTSLCIEAVNYITEAQKRFNLYNASKVQMDIELKRKKDELSFMNAERKKLGLFAFSKKKELDLAIKEQSENICEYEKTHESKKLWAEFMNMYSDPESGIQ